jgi:hypothetical protein
LTAVLWAKFPEGGRTQSGCSSFPRVALPGASADL